MLTAYDGKAITYDGIGNPLSYNGNTYTWEMADKLVSISGNSLTASYQYNEDGIRTEKTVNGVTTTYHLNGDQVTYESNGTDTIYYTYDGNGTLVSMNLNGTEYYYIYNNQGDVIGLVDNTGTQVVSYTYDTWGKMLSVTGTLASTVGKKNPYRYRGYRYDSESGMYYLQSRYYNPEWGRFINADSELGTHPLDNDNLFAYVNNNPVNNIDPNGNFNWGFNFASRVIVGLTVAIEVGSLFVKKAATFVIKKLAKSVTKVIPKKIKLLKHESKPNLKPKTKPKGKGNVITSNKGNKIDITPSKNHSSTNSVPHPGKGQPNSSVDILDKKTGEIKTRRFYNSEGKAERDIDFTNHGNPKMHPEWPHEHVFQWNEDATFSRILKIK